MRFEEFWAQFAEASKAALAFARRFVVTPLPDDLRYHLDTLGETVCGTQPDDLPRRKILGGRILTEDKLRGLKADRAAKFLWVDGKLPEWINLNVENADAQYTYVRVLASSLLVKDVAECLYRCRDGATPFHILGPNIGGAYPAVRPDQPQF